MRGLSRTAAGLAMAGLVLASALTGASEAFLTRALVAGLRLCGFEGVHPVHDRLFAVGGSPYAVDFWCTPTALALCLLLLLWFARQPAPAYALTSAAALLGGSALMFGNILLSVFLHQRLGLDWAWAHLPGLAGVYAVSLGAGLVAVERGTGRTWFRRLLLQGEKPAR